MWGALSIYINAIINTLNKLYFIEFSQQPPKGRFCYALHLPKGQLRHKLSHLVRGRTSPTQVPDS